MRPLILALLALAATAIPAHATSCAHAVSVDGHVLEVLHAAGSSGLPGLAPIEAEIPECGHGGSTPIEVVPLQGVPPTVAVEYDHFLFVNRATLVAVAGHPLRALARAPERKRCEPGDAVLAGTVAEEGGDGFTVSGRVLEVDRRTRITNRPAHQPLLEGQRVKVRATRCRPHWFADRIAFVGRTVHPHDAEEPVSPAYLLIPAAALLVAVRLWPRRRAV